MKREQILERSRREGLDEREQQIYLDAYNFSGSVCVGLCLLLTVGSILRSESFYPYSILVFAAIASSFLYRFVRLRKVSFLGWGLAALVLALIGMAAACGCAKRAEADATFVMLTAPTVEPIVTPVPTPESTPPPKKTPKAEKTPEDNKKEDEAKEKEKPKSTADQKEEKKASAKTPHAKDYTKVDIKKASGTKVTDFETDRIDGGKLSQSYFSGGTITLVNVWSTT